MSKVLLSFTREVGHFACSGALTRIVVHDQPAPTTHRRRQVKVKDMELRKWQVQMSEFQRLVAAHGPLKKAGKKGGKGGKKKKKKK